MCQRARSLLMRSSCEALRVKKKMGSGPQHSVCRSPGSVQVQCTSWRNFAPLSSSTFKTIHVEQAGKRDRGGSAVGALEAHSVRTQHNTTCINMDIKRAQGVCPWSASQEGARGQGFSACRGTPSRGEARALHHQPVPALTLTMPCLSCSRFTLDYCARDGVAIVVVDICDHYENSGVVRTIWINAIVNGQRR
jgi:hypothetical protein